MSLALLARTWVPTAHWTPAAMEIAADARERIGVGRLGDRHAIARYVGRANRLAGISLISAIPLSFAAWLVHSAIGVVVVVLIGAFCDWQRGRLACSIRVEGDHFVIESGPWTGRRVKRSDVQAIGFGAPARYPYGKPPETFWSGDFGGVARSHLVVIRLHPGRVPSRRLLVPEAGLAEAQSAQRRLTHWCSGDGS